MTDTSTKPTTKAVEHEKVGKKNKLGRVVRPRDVKYGEDIGLGALDELPPSPPRNSKLTLSVKEIAKTPNKWIPVSSYVDPGTASGVGTTLRKRFDAKDGWEFASKRVGDRSIVFAKFNKA